MSWRAELLSFLRVPHAPSAPAGDEDVRVFRAAPNYFRYKVARWVLTNCSGLVGLYFGLAFLRSGPARFLPSNLVKLIYLIEIAAIGIFLIQAAWSLALLRLDFEQRWYLVSDRSLRIREGLVRMDEKTMTFANIQQVTIEQGPLQRLLGIADLQVRTAGGGGSGGESTPDKGRHRKDDLHVAYFHGVDNAAAIRETIRERLRRHADAGLGDPDDHHHAAIAASATDGGSLLHAARALRAEAVALRRAALTVQPQPTKPTQS
jgi:hypothetical protein